MAPQWLQSRWALAKRLYGRPLVRAGLGLYVTFAFVQWVVGEFGSPWLVGRVRLGNNIPSLSGWQWAVIGLGLLLIIGFEGTVRGFAKPDQKAITPAEPDTDYSRKTFHDHHGETTVEKDTQRIQSIKREQTRSVQARATVPTPTVETEPEPQDEDADDDHIRPPPRVTAYALKLLRAKGLNLENGLMGGRIGDPLTWKPTTSLDVQRWDEEAKRVMADDQLLLAQWIREPCPFGNVEQYFWLQRKNVWLSQAISWAERP